MGCFCFRSGLDGLDQNPQFGYTFGITVCALIGFAACMLSYYLTRERNTNDVVEDVTESSEIKFTDILVVFRKNRACPRLPYQLLPFSQNRRVGR